MTEAIQEENGKVQLEIRKGPDAVLSLGGLQFVACRREVDTIDGGITLIVWSDPENSEDEALELLRFDFFRNRPHYHSPASNRSEIQIDPEQHGDGQVWGIDQLTTSARELVAAAGFDQVAAKIEGSALAGGRIAMKTLFSELAEPTEISYFEVDAKLLTGLR